MNPTLDLDQLMSVFESYNLAIWPMQIFAYLAALLGLYAASKETRFSNNITSGIQSFFWLWTGGIFCLFHWAPVYPAAYAFGVLFIAQGILFLVDSVRPKLSYRAGNSSFTLIGLGVIAYAMIGYPFVGYLLGRLYPHSLPFGLVPCPTTVYTIGLLMLTDKPVPKRFLVIPAVWAICAVVPVASGIYEDAGLLIAGIICIPIILRRDRQKSLSQSQQQ